MNDEARATPRRRRRRTRMTREHREEHRQREVVVVHRAVLRLERGAGTGSRLLHRGRELAMRRMITKKTLAAMIVPSITPTGRDAARGEELLPRPRLQAQAGADPPASDLAPLPNRPAAGRRRRAPERDTGVAQYAIACQSSRSATWRVDRERRVEVERTTRARTPRARSLRPHWNQSSGSSISRGRETVHSAW